ncbi:hypothetical protein E4U55_002776 [Claviceps digitariae]|nr:hypothetical protein E4U55_002776 [Claviceps digitariae]
MKFGLSLTFCLMGLTAQVTANDAHDAYRRQKSYNFAAPRLSTLLEPTGRMSILPILTHQPSSSSTTASDEPPTTIGRITGSAPPPTDTGTRPDTSQVSTTTTTTATATPSHVSSGAAAALPAPTLAHYIAGVIALAGMGIVAM